MADILRVSKRTIYRAMKIDALDQVMVRGHVMVKVPLEIQTMQSKGDRLLRPAEVAEIFQCHMSSIYRWFHEGQLDGFLLGGEDGTLRIYESSVKAFIENKGY